MNEQNGSRTGARFLLLSLICTAAGVLFSRFFILPECSIFLGLFALCVYSGIQGTLFSVSTSVLSFLPAVIGIAVACTAGDMRVFALLNIAFGLLAGSLLSLFAARKTPRHIVFTAHSVLFCIHILLILAALIIRTYGAFSAETVRTAVNDTVAAFTDAMRSAMNDTLSLPMFGLLPEQPDIEAMLEGIAFTVRANIISAICLFAMIPAAVTTIFYSLAARFLGDEAKKHCIEQREWLYLPPRALSHFFYLTYFGYILFNFIDNDRMFVAFYSLSFVLSLPLAYVGLRFAAWLLGTKIRSKALVRLIVIGGSIAVSFFSAGFGLLRIVAALLGAFVTLRTRIQTNSRQGGNE